MYFILKLLLCISLAIILTTVDVESKKSKINRRFVGFPLNLRYKPVTRNINTTETKSCSTLKPLLVSGDLIYPSSIVNTGQSIQSYNQQKPNAFLTGSTLGDTKYIWVSFTYYWDSPGNESTGVTGTTIDKKGFPYGVRALFINENYKTFEEALQHKDGFADLVFLFNICDSHNLLFDPLSKAIQKVAKAGSCVFMPLCVQILGTTDFCPTSQYYTYLGDFRDSVTGKTYRSSRVFVFKPEKPLFCISQQQFEDTFCPLKDFKGDRLTNTLPHDDCDGCESQTELCSGFFPVEVTFNPTRFLHLFSKKHKPFH